MKKTVLALLFTLPLFAQKAQPATVTIQQVNDRRTNGSFAELSISLELPKIHASEVAASRVLVAAAVDDSGRSLIDPESGEPMLDPNPRMNAENTNPATVSVTLKNPARSAKTVKEVRGEIELYMPSKDPNSIADIAKFLSFSGKALAHRALKANGVDISLVSTAQYDAEKKRFADVKRKELKEAGYEDGTDLEGLVSSYLESEMHVDDGDLVVRIKDPNKRIQQISYVAGTETKNVSTNDRGGFVILSTWGEKPQADWTLRVSMKTAKNLVRQSFALNDVPLP